MKPTRKMTSPVLHIELLIDETINYEAMSFMEEHAGISR